MEGLLNPQANCAVNITPTSQKFAFVDVYPHTADPKCVCNLSRYESPNTNARIKGVPTHESNQHTGEALSRFGSRARVDARMTIGLTGSNRALPSWRVGKLCLVPAISEEPGPK